MNELRVNWAFFTPSLAATLRPQDLPHLKTLVLGGEAIAAKNIEDWAGDVSLHNGYGPTETCVFCLTDKIEPFQGPVLGHAVGSIAWIADTDDLGTLAPVGAVGELLVQGPIVGRGYLGDDDNHLTDRVFLPATAVQDIGQTATGDRVYRTGDLVRYREDGAITYVGRKDSQVKLRGQRIELDEVSHKIEELYSETERAVAEVIRPFDNPESQMLVAFMHIQETAPDTTDEPPNAEQPDWVAPRSPSFIARASHLHGQLADVLPPYMVPQAFIAVRRVPVSLNGKAERGKLRDWAAKLGTVKLAEYGQQMRTVKRKPVTEAEMLLSGLWEEVLQLFTGSVGAGDNFFVLSADSIRVMALVSVARKVGLSATVTDVITNPGLERMAKVFVAIGETKAREVTEVKEFELFGDVDLLADILEPEFD